MEGQGGSSGAPLMRNGRFMRLWAGQAVSFVGDAISLVALVVLVVDLTGSAASVGGILVARLVPTFFSPFIGVLADRLTDRRRMLVAVDVVRAVLIFGIVFVQSIPVLYGIVFLLGVCQTLFNPVIRSSFPGVVGDGDITRANALISGTFSLSIAVGPAVGGLLISAVGVQTAFLIDAATFLVSAAFLAFVPMYSSREEDDEEESFIGELKGGLAYLRRARIPLALTVGSFLLILAENITVPAEVFLARATFDAGDAGYGLVVAFYGGGMVFGSAVMAWVGERANLVVFYFGSIFLAAAGLLAIGMAPAFPIALAALAVAGTCNGIDNVSTDALLQTRVPEKLLGRVYSVMYFGRSSGEVIALAAGGFIVAATGPQQTYVIASLGVAVFGMVILLIAATTPKKDRSPLSA